MNVTGDASRVRPRASPMCAQRAVMVMPCQVIRFSLVRYSPQLLGQSARAHTFRDGGWRSASGRARMPTFGKSAFEFAAIDFLSSSILDRVQDVVESTPLRSRGFKDPFRLSNQDLHRICYWLPAGVHWRVSRGRVTTNWVTIGRETHSSPLSSAPFV